MMQRRTLVALGCTLPFAALLAFILVAGVDLPFMDQWMFLNFLDGVFGHEGSATWILSQLHVQHNEHRLFFPKLVMTGLAVATHWNTHAERVASWCCLVLLFFAFRRLLARTGREHGGLLVVIACLLCSLQQHENLTWGWQLQIFMSVTAVVWSITLLTEPGRGIKAAVVCAFIASFSFLNGASVWVLGGLALLLRPDLDRGTRRAYLGYWCTAAVVAAVVFLIDYHRADFDYARHPVTVQAMLTYFGRVFGRPAGGGWPTTARWAGYAGIAAFLIAFGTVVARRRDLAARLGLGLAGLYSFVSGTAIAIGRTSHGIAQAMSPRYVTILTPLWIFVLCTAGLALRGKPLRAAGWVFAVVFAVLQWQAWGEARAHRSMLLEARTALIRGEGMTRALAERLYPTMIGAGTGRGILRKHRLSLFRDDAAFARSPEHAGTHIVLTAERRGRRLHVTVGGGLPGRVLGLYAILPGPEAVPLTFTGLDDHGVFELDLPVEDNQHGKAFSLIALSMNEIGAVILSPRLRVVL